MAGRQSVMGGVHIREEGELQSRNQTCRAVLPLSLLPPSNPLPPPLSLSLLQKVFIENSRLMHVNRQREKVRVPVASRNGCSEVGGDVCFLEGGDRRALGASWLLTFLTRLWHLLVRRSFGVSMGPI